MPSIRAVVFDFYETLVQLNTQQRETLFDNVATELGLDLPAGEAYHHWAVYTTRDADLRLGGTERTAFEGEENAELDEQIVDETELGYLDATTCTVRFLTQTQYYGVARTGRGSVAFKSQAGSEEQLMLVKDILATLREE